MGSRRNALGRMVISNEVSLNLTYLCECMCGLGIYENRL